MAKSLPNDTLDEMLEDIATSTQLDITSDTGTPADLSNSLASVALTPGDGNGDFAIADGDSSGRKLTIAAQSSVAVSTPGTARHVILSLSGTFKLITTCVEGAISGTVNIPSFKIELSDP